MGTRLLDQALSQAQPQSLSQLQGLGRVRHQPVRHVHQGLAGAGGHEKGRVRECLIEGARAAEDPRAGAWLWRNFIALLWMLLVCLFCGETGPVH